MLNLYARRTSYGPVILNWLAFMVALTFLSGLTYLLAQQTLRQSANDPQIQMAEDAANALAGGKEAQAVLPAGKINMADSLAPYLIIYDESGKPVAASVELNGSTPQVPPEVFSDSGQKRFTWQPASGIRSAAVLAHYKSGYVLAGRSLREVENRENQLFQLVGIAWVAVCLVTTLLFASPFLFLTRIFRRV